MSNKLKTFSKNLSILFKSTFFTDNKDIQCTPNCDLSNNLNDSYNNWQTRNSIELRNVNLFYSKDKKGMNNCNMMVEPGAFHVIIGNNGAGKSTTMSVITGLNTNYTGEVLLNGLNIKTNPEAKQGLTYILERTNFPIGMTVEKYLKTMAQFNVNDDDKIKELIDKGLEWLNIKDLKNKNPRKLSSGQKKKVFALRALVENPKILILDEPFANLDPDSRNRLYSILKKINENGTTILLSTHILREVDGMADSVTLIKDGEIVFCGKIDDQNTFFNIYNQYFQNYIFQ